MDTPRARRKAAIVAGCCDRGNAGARGAFISWQVWRGQRLFASGGRELPIHRRGLLPDDVHLPEHRAFHAMGKRVGLADLFSSSNSCALKSPEVIRGLRSPYALHFAFRASTPRIAA